MVVTPGIKPLEQRLVPPKPSRRAFGAPKELFETSVDEISEMHNILAERAARKKENRTRILARALSITADEDEDSDTEAKKLEPIESALFKVRGVAERLLESHQMDLRGFEGEAMDEETFRLQVKTQLGVKLSRAETRALVSHMDENGDGQIDFKEVLHHFLNPERLRTSARRAFRRRTVIDRFRLTMNKIREAAAKVKLEDVFKKFDEDGDRRISRDEFTQVLQDELMLDLDDREVNEVFRQFDPNNDGSLSFSEFSFAFYNYRTFEKSIINSKEFKHARRRTRPPFMPC